MQEEWLILGDKIEDSHIHMFKKITKSSITHLQIWSKKTFGGIKKKLKELMQKLKGANQCNVQYVVGLKSEALSSKFKICRLIRRCTRNKGQGMID